MLEQIEIIEKTLEVYKKCDVNAFPIDCFKIITGLGIPLYKYSDLPEAKIDKCLQVSNDAFTLQGIIFYNDNFPHKERQRFSLMHEVGHIVLGHRGICIENEKEADCFASNILAPRAVIRHLDCKTVKGIYDTFMVSCMAANRILEDYNSILLGEHKNLHMSIRNWFFPRPKIENLIQPEYESKNNETGFDFFNTHRFLMGEEHIFECSEFHHLHG